MEKRLNIDLINAQLEKNGFNQTDLADKLRVSKEIISKWLKSVYFPSPKHLLELGKVLNLKFSELVIKEDVYEPVVAFRKVAGKKITEEHSVKAKNMGYSIEALMPYLSEPVLTKAPVLKEPTYNYDYINAVVFHLRNKIVVNDGPLVVEDIINLLANFNAYLIPILWGTKNNHRNAVHIYLPKSETTWVFLNLDSKLCDFKFWMVHELGHIIAKNIAQDVAEQFADDFAGALLFPYEAANALYCKLAGASKKTQINTILAKADEYLISPLTIYFQINKFANHSGKTKIYLEESIHALRTTFDKKYKLVSVDYLGKETPSAKEYIFLSESKFNTPIFEALRNYYKNNELNAGIIQQLFDISTIDARNILEALSNGES